MNIQKSFKTSLLAVCCGVMMGPVMASTTDGLTPSVEAVCDALDGKAFGICNAYCEAMDCDNPNHKASDKACAKKFSQWVALNGEDVPIPCESASLLLTKSASTSDSQSADGSLVVDVGEEVTYNIEVTNTGAIPIIVSEVNDSILQNLNCDPVLEAELLPGEKVLCQESVTYQEEGMHVNTALSEGFTEGGYPVISNDVTLSVDVQEPSTLCPCAYVWESTDPEGDIFGSGGSPELTNPPTGQLQGSNIIIFTGGFNCIGAGTSYAMSEFILSSGEKVGRCVDGSLFATGRDDVRVPGGFTPEQFEACEVYLKSHGCE